MFLVWNPASQQFQNCHNFQEPNKRGVILSSISEKAYQNVPWDRGRQVNYEPRFEVIFANQDRIENYVHIDVVHYHAGSKRSYFW